ncbi:WD40 repeat-like protein [Dichomitus squalens]|uniref:WD40 repeat-like protein n=1 Tax=Dichomitus squalens TaxID=114155 RepID=A0A4Q9QDQ5_9APHY|nr:WD40 repeat-like protein [Dichomitus squalens]
MPFRAYLADYERRHGPVTDHTGYSGGGGGVETGRDVREREELAFRILASLPRSSLAVLQHRIEPLLKLDIVGLLPTEVALEVFSYLPYQSLLTCALVCTRWRVLADDQSLWKSLCLERKWEWRVRPDAHETDARSPPDEHVESDLDDEGMGDEEDDDLMHVDDSGFASMDINGDDTVRVGLPSTSSFSATAHLSLTINSSHTLPDLLAGPSRGRMRSPRERHSAPSILHTSAVQKLALASPPNPDPKPDYKILHQTHVKLRNRFTTGQYTLSNLQTRGAPNGHTNTIYCLQLYTYPESGTQVLFTGSKDRTVREWDLQTGAVIRVLEGAHESSVLSICAHRGLLASASSDRRVVVWDLVQNKVIRTIRDHEDSVLCVRFDDKRLVSCSKDRTVRTYLFPHLGQQHVLSAHRAAVNAVSIANKHIISVSGDRSLRLWDADTGACLRTFENHHRRGIASIDYKHPFVLSGSSDKHIRLLDVSTLQGWSTNPAVTDKPAAAAPGGLGRTVPVVCESCGSSTSAGEPSQPPRRRAHEDLVRSVALSSDLVISGSYDFTVKVWDRKTGALVADLAGGHTGRIFCVGSDCTKIVSCGEDQRICIWDFSHGIDTSFLKL